VLTPFDDYPIHQTPEPVAHPVTGDRNFYDRYFFNGHSPDGSLFFALALGLYPNRRVMDASFSVVRDGVQRSLHASRLAPTDRTEIGVGPITVEVVEPLRRLRLGVAAPEHGLEADLLFHARSLPLEEPRFTRHDGGRVVMDLTRLTQFGSWEGWIAVEGRRVAIERAQVLGCRDRSWGVRGVGEREAGAPPGGAPQFFWLWAPLQFGDVCTHFAVNEDGDGRPWHASGSWLQGVAPPTAPAAAPLGEAEPLARVEHHVRWTRGTRRAASAELVLTPHGGPPHHVQLEPILSFQMLGLGYLHPEWGHGIWKGEQAVAAESWKLADCAPMDPRHLHVQTLCRARMEGRQGIGVLEQLVIGPHAPSGFKDLLDPAS